MEYLQLNLINRSQDANNSQIVIFQQNEADSYEEIAVAWRVIENCRTGDSYPFRFPMQYIVGANTSDGNYVPTQYAVAGEAFNVTGETQYALDFCRRGPEEPQSIQVNNNLNENIDVNIYKDGRLLAVKSDVNPSGAAVFEFKPTIWIGVTSNITEGEIMNSAIIANINTELNLLGIAKANIIMTDGGSVTDNQFQFTLEPLD
ncbi:hypothetical protein HYN48_12060 [Flavobacterium magnum]|uniref:Aromatic ring-opening dioxygenase LigA n=1 Tax=Flavobacterium magnum TaxID=2162713 RepID=A0A2S0RGG9_9FLAO|nr:hypothetical protein [Flavobacterium magnum]AWA30756.1 hypothetical protein HYN48_12060 [Flavobacterium magnum]